MAMTFHHSIASLYAFGTRRLAFDVWRSVRKIRSDFGFVITRAKTGSRKQYSLGHYCENRAVLASRSIVRRNVFG
jgi:hypothetical protein